LFNVTPAQKIESSWLKFSDRNEANFHALPEGSGNPPQHGEGMAFVVGVFQPAHYGCSGANQSGQLALGETGVGAELENLPGDVLRRAHLLQRRKPLRTSGIITLVQNVEAILCFFAGFAHGNSSS
jgi:hypothetical protein